MQTQKNNTKRKHIHITIDMIITITMRTLIIRNNIIHIRSNINKRIHIRIRNSKHIRIHVSKH